MMLGFKRKYPYYETTWKWLIYYIFSCLTVIVEMLTFGYFTTDWADRWHVNSILRKEKNDNQNQG